MVNYNVNDLSEEDTDRYDEEYESIYRQSNVRRSLV